MDDAYQHVTPLCVGFFFFFPLTYCCKSSVDFSQVWVSLCLFDLDVTGTNPICGERSMVHVLTVSPHLTFGKCVTVIKYYLFIFTTATFPKYWNWIEWRHEFDTRSVYKGGVIWACFLEGSVWV